MKATGTIIIDPPWPYAVGAGISDPRPVDYRGRERRKQHYQTMSLEALRELPIGKLGDYLFLWSTVGFIEQSYALIRAWGFTPVTAIFRVKVRALELREQDGGKPRLSFRPHYGVGHWFRGAVEPIIVAKKKNAPTIRSKYIGLFSAASRHSRKPTSLHEVIEELYPRPYVEVFAREGRKNWVTMGNEVTGERPLTYKGDIREGIERLVAKKNRLK